MSNNQWPGYGQQQPQPGYNGQQPYNTAGIWRATPVRLRRAATLRRQRLRCAPTTTEEKPHRPDSRARRGPGHRPGLRSLVVPRQGQPANRRSVRDRHHHAGVLADSQQHRPDPRQDVEINSPGLGNRGSPLDEDLRRRFKRFRHAPRDAQVVQWFRGPEPEQGPHLVPQGVGYFLGLLHQG